VHTICRIKGKVYKATVIKTRKTRYNILLQW